MNWLRQTSYRQVLKNIYVMEVVYSERYDTRTDIQLLARQYI